MNNINEGRGVPYIDMLVTIGERVPMASCCGLVQFALMRVIEGELHIREWHASDCEIWDRLQLDGTGYGATT